MAKKWKKNKKPKKRKKGIPNNHRRLPVGQVINQFDDNARIRGEYMALPMFGWVGVRQRTEDPLVMLVAILLSMGEEPGPVASLQIEMPVFEETELSTLAVLEGYGWDGRVWPIDDGWPDGDEENYEQLTALMEQSGLRASMTFPPKEDGSAAAGTVNVQRAQGPFLMPPLPKFEGEPDAEKLAKLRNLCANPRQFQLPMKPAERKLDLIGVD